jgi:hypothetical protein
VLNFHEHRPDSLGVMKLTNALSCSACPLNKSEFLYCLTCLNKEPCLGDRRRVVVLFISFLNS